MTGLTGDVGYMVVEEGLFVRCRSVAIFAAELAFCSWRNTQRVAGDNVVLGDMTLLAGEVLTVQSHVNIDIFLRVRHGGVKVAMLDCITTATIEVAGSAVVSHRLTNVLGRS